MHLFFFYFVIFTRVNFTFLVFTATTKSFTVKIQKAILTLDLRFKAERSFFGENLLIHIADGT
ncbi:hypothetical protein BpHYR1_048448 [Brachionus plicatilis]|uniref:Uncharacterized protein n=1 Tax=Brachionus plicatilis TaxID=10195 RepID=A0A3M7RMA6_BRAPC|nr:hypothetical protein BpHYR1_048448 [Brachionus plicatilis]